jgi:AcrR family transcriptional regulator
LTGKRPPGRPASQALEGRLLEAALSLVEETRSFDGLSVDAVCNRAGASKASFYRRWPDREAFILATLDRLRPPPLPKGETPSLRRDLISVLNSIFGTDVRRTRIVHAALIAEGRRNRDLKDRYLAEIVEPRRRALLHRLSSAVAGGSLAADTDVQSLYEMLTAPVLKLILMADPDEPVPPDFVERLVDQALRGLIPANPAKNT